MAWEQSVQPKLLKSVTPKTLAIMQPTYLPWCGYFDLMDQVDEFLLLDTAAFSKQSFHQRNRIRTQQGLLWLTIPVKIKGQMGQALNEVELVDHTFLKKHLKAIEMNYKKAPFFETYREGLREIYEAAYESLTEFTVTFIMWLRDQLGITTPVIKTSELISHPEFISGSCCNVSEILEQVQSDKILRLTTFCKQVQATHYISPLGAKDYLEESPDAFEKAGVTLSYQNYSHPDYKQLYEPFMPYASILDLLLIKGPEASTIMRTGRK